MIFFRVEISPDIPPEMWERLGTEGVNRQLAALIDVMQKAFAPTGIAIADYVQIDQRVVADFAMDELE